MRLASLASRCSIRAKINPLQINSQIDYRQVYRHSERCRQNHKESMTNTFEQTYCSACKKLACISIREHDFLQSFRIVVIRTMAKRREFTDRDTTQRGNKSFFSTTQKRTYGLFSFLRRERARDYDKTWVDQPTHST